MKRVYLGLMPSSLLLVGSFLIPFQTNAQVTPDGTLSTTVTSPDGQNFTIEGGNRPNGGGNLFHSFQDFSVPTNGSAVFNNANDIANIISRVTGGNFSNIDGLIKANGSANLFLINPAGIIFGPNARLDIGGSFFGSTADSLLFPEGEFSAVDTQAEPLLTINIPIGLRFRDNPQPIINVSVADNVGLQVKPGETLGLIGGNVLFGLSDLSLSGKITAPGSKVELGGLLSTGTITIEDDFKLSFPEEINRADVFLSAAEVNVASDGGGAININGGNIALIEGSQLVGGIAEGLGNPNSQAGDITLNATGAVTLSDESSIQNPVNRNAIGNSGDINVNADSLTLTSGSFFSTSTFSLGNGGDINVNVAEAVTISGFSQEDNIFSQIQSRLGSGAEGTAGDINIEARSLSLDNGGFLSSSTFGSGSAGDINIDVEEAVTLNNSGRIFSTVDTTAIAPEGERSTITIQAGSLSITNTDNLISNEITRIDTSTEGTGNAGNIVIDIDGDINIVDGEIRTFVNRGADGNGGNINIVGRSLSLKDEGFLRSLTFGQGNAGNITIDVNENISLVNNSFIASSVFNDSLDEVGQGGQINLTAQSVSLSETSFITTGTSSGNERSNGGNIEINVAGPLNLTGGSFLVSSTEGKGNAGNILINATDSISVTEESQLQAATSSEGNAGNIVIDAENADIFLSDAFVNTSVILGSGEGGDIKITGRTLYVSDGAFLFTNTAGKAIGERLANAGNIQIETSDSITFNGGAQIFSNTVGQGNAGNVTISAGGAVSFDGVNSNIESGVLPFLSEELATNFTQERQGGDINIIGRSLSLDNGARLNTSSSGQGNAGNITLDIQDIVNVSGFALNSEETFIFATSVRSVLEAGAEGKAGDITIKARSLLLEDRGRINNTTSGFGNAGDINIDVDDSIDLFRSSTISNSVGQGGVGNGGELDIQAKSLTLTEGSQISAVVSRAGFNTPGGEGKGGNLKITATDFVDISGVSSVQLNIPDFSNDPSNTTGLIPTAGFSSGLLAATERGATGEGGSIIVTTDAFRIADGGVVDNSTTNDSKAGDITINANSFEATGGGQIITATRGGGDAADIKLNIADSILISGSDPNFAARLARAEEFGTIQGGGNIVTNQGAASGIFANTSVDSTGNGGNIEIGIFKQQEGEDLTLDTNQFTQEIILANGAKIAADSQGKGSGGAISIQAQDFTLDNQAEVLAETEAQQEDNTAISEINLGVANILQLKNDSRISTQALSNADGGDINIDAKFIVAFPGQNEGNDILTRAAQGGNGGNINITTEALLGIEERKATPGNRTNDIDASSEFGLSGEVIITRPDVDPTRGLLELTQEVVDPADLIAQNVCTQTADSEFVDIGKGGLPQNPQDRLTDDVIEVGLVQPITSSGAEISSNREITAVKPQKNRKPPAQGWIFHENGIVELVAYNPNEVGEQRTLDNPRGCQ